MSRPSLVLVGGFLGAGKTTLLLHAAKLLRQRGLRAGIITNDQAGSLVDTRLAEGAGLPVEEVAGGCFCCRLSDFLASADRLLGAGLDVLFAEPVGSCTDISATILQPVKHDHRSRYRLAPFTVLVDPERAATPMDEDVAFLFRNQLAEADVVLFSKADMYDSFPELPGGAMGAVSGRTGAGVAEWLDMVLAPDAAAGTRILNVDYARYAAAEAALGWLNLRARLKLKSPLTPSYVVGPLLEDLDTRLTAAGSHIVHLKVLAQGPTGYVRAGLVRNGDEPGVDGDLAASPAMDFDVVINLRALASPDVLLDVVDGAVAGLPGHVSVEERTSFRPSPPQPEQHFDRIVN